MDRAAHRSYASHRSSLFALFSVSDGWPCSILLPLACPCRPQIPQARRRGRGQARPRRPQGSPGSGARAHLHRPGRSWGSICLQRPRAHRVELELASTGRRLVGQKVGRGLAMEGGKASWDLGGMVGDGWRRFKEADILTGRRMLREELNQ